MRRCAAVPGTQLFLADDMEAQALTAKRKWWQAAPQLWVRCVPPAALRRTSPLTLHIAAAQVVRIADEAQGGSEEVEEVNFAMVYLYGDLPQLLSFEARDDAERFGWLMRSFGFNTIDAVPVPTEVRSRAAVSRACVPACIALSAWAPRRRCARWCS